MSQAFEKSSDLTEQPSGAAGQTLNIISRQMVA
jgi:hypothetical protein